MEVKASCCGGETETALLDDALLDDDVVVFFEPVAARERTLSATRSETDL